MQVKTIEGHRRYNRILWEEEDTVEETIRTWQSTSKWKLCPTTDFLLPINPMKVYSQPGSYIWFLGIIKLCVLGCSSTRVY